MRNNSVAMALIGFGLGLALALGSVKLYSDYWQNRIAENAQVHLNANFSTGRTPPQLTAPPVPGSQVLKHDIAQFGELKLKSLDGRTITLNSLRGRPVFLNLWETSCIPCVQELPSIKKLVASMRDQPLNIVLLAFEDEARVRAFVGSEHLPVYLSDERLIPPTLHGRGVPQTYILDRNGEVAFHHAGAADWDNDDVRAYLRKLVQ